MMLTERQHELLSFIEARLAENGVSPSFDEMMKALNLKSKNGVFRLITNLEDRGFVRRMKGKARAIEILKLPDGTRPAAQAETDVLKHLREGGEIIIQNHLTTPSCYIHYDEWSEQLVDRNGDYHSVSCLIDNYYISIHHEEVT
jgi:SOS-response transcriptional repressor LexA